MRKLALSFIVTVVIPPATSCNPPPPEPEPVPLPPRADGPLCTADVKDTPCDVPDKLCYLLNSVIC